MVGLITAGLSLIPQVARYFTGVKQKKQAEQIRNSNSLENQQLPPEIEKMLNITKSRAYGGGMPGQKRAETRLSQNTANIIDSLLQTGSGASASANMVGTVQGNENNAVLDLADQGALYAAQGADGLRQALSTAADFRQNSFDKAMAAAAALEGAGMNNKFNAVTGAVSSAMSFVDANGWGAGKDNIDGDGEVGSDLGKALATDDPGVAKSSFSGRDFMDVLNQGWQAKNGYRPPYKMGEGMFGDLLMSQPDLSVPQLQTSSPTFSGPQDWASYMKNAWGSYNNFKKPNSFSPLFQ
jgi:hypothetical protein